MRVEQRVMRDEQWSTQPQLREAQKRLYDLYWKNDLEIYDEQGNIIATTSKDNPNLDEILAHFRDEELARRSGQ